MSEVGTAAGIAAAVRAGERTARSVVEESLAAIDAREAELHTAQRRARRRGTGGRRRDRRRRRQGGGPGAARRRARRAEGQPLHPGDPDDVLLADPRGLAAAVHGDRRAACARRRRHSDRQDEPRRVRDGLVDRELRFRCDPQSPRPVTGGRRLERRIGGGGRGRVRAARAGLRHRGDRSASRRRCAAWWASSRPTVGSAATASIAFASSLDQIGPFATTVDDAALLLEAIWGHDRMDSTSIADVPAPLAGAADVAGLRVGVVGGAHRRRRRRPERAERRRARGDRARGRRCRRSIGCPCRAACTDCPRTTSSRRPRRRRTSPATTACATGCASTATDAADMNARTRQSGLRSRGQAPDHARHLRAVRRLLRRVLRQGAAGPHADHPRLRRPRSSASTCCCRRRRRPRRSRSARRRAIRSPCTCPTCARSRPTSPATPRSACRSAAAAPGCPIGVQVLAPALGEPVMFRAARRSRAAAVTAASSEEDVPRGAPVEDAAASHWRKWPAPVTTERSDALGEGHRTCAGKLAGTTWSSGP